MQQYEFQTQSKKLLWLMVHSIYPNKEIFLRELISNGSDAIDKLLYLGLTDDKVPLTRETAEIRLSLDKAARTLTVSDNGIGMDEAELRENLGVIAHSGSQRFREALEADRDTAAELIGQFGVGFYSAFLVADRVTVISRRYGADRAWKWESDGQEGYSLEPAARASCGTDVILHIRPDGKDQDEYSRFVREYPIYKLVKKYSDYIRFPIRMLMPQPKLKAGSTPENPEFEEEFVLETFNTMVPLWERPKEELTRADYDDFYRVRYSDPEKPLKVIRASVEGAIRYKALVFLPGARPKDYDTDLWQPGLELYCAGVRIMEHCSALLPEEFRFVRGVVEAPDLNLNISREQLQQEGQIRQIRANLAKKIRTVLDKMLAQERSSYEKLWRSFGLDLKIAALDNYAAKKEQLQDLLLFGSSAGLGLVTLKEYLSRMPADQKNIYYAVGPSPRHIEQLPQLDLLRERGWEVLYCLDRTDQLVMDMFRSYGGKPFRSAADGDLELGGEDRKPDKAWRDCFDFVRDCLGDRVTEVKASSRLKDHPVCLSSGSGISYDMERYLAATQPQLKVKAKRILELNTAHPAIQALETARKTDRELAKKYTEILYNQALLIAGLPIRDPSGYTDLLVSLWETKGG
ncbi:MAG: molecular chaperone HtpG [Oscillospiraceae bacterium]|nr:molecular chaperone HtpG [Oscillospiraceae bacterium]